MRIPTNRTVSQRRLYFVKHVDNTFCSFHLIHWVDPIPLGRSKNLIHLPTLVFTARVRSLLHTAYMLSVCLSICVCIYVCLSIKVKTFESLDIENSFLLWLGHLYHISVKFECQDHWVKVKVTLVNGLFELLDTGFLAVAIIWYEYCHQGQGCLKVKAFQNQTVSVMISISK